ncbi:hypothetical protein PPYR_11082 [Photinus pyralis]|uniref:DUF4745 domain-containing protein n=1 Tax=Photinus pyralis TaxID=7054 RepID=A0A1Y1MBG4_PHOPY|nr:uncharacterized protein LOC116173352 isoform X1 [Photinus pyralis]KAB0797021.1 hypothetical protein PPYR_11082 [Photinus pyralis]
MEEESQTEATGEASEAQPKEPKAASDTPQPPSPNALKVAATECLNSWIYYLQMLNSLCLAGAKLSHSLFNLAQSQNISLATQCQASWDELTKATTYASHTVKAHIAAAMQDMIIGETFTEDDAQRQQEHNQQIIAENLLTFINLQYQFSIASCECMGPMAMCPSCQTTPGGQHDPECSMAALQQCFSQFYSSEPRSLMSSPHFADSPKGPEVKMHEHPRQHSPINIAEPRGSSPYNEPFRGSSPVHGFIGHSEVIRGPFPNPGQLHTMKSPFPMRGSRSPLHFPLFPLAGQRRWSEAAAGDVGGESSDSTMRRWSMPWDCGRVETAPWQQRYFPTKLVVPGTSDRSRSTTPEAVAPQPGTITSGEGLAEAIQLLSCRPMRCAIPHGPTSWGEGHEERLPRRAYPGPLQRGIWQSIDVPPTSGMSVTEHYDIFPPVIPLTSRKSSSSTDSSSCLSIHSRSTTSSSERGSDAGGEAVRLHTNLYSIWSGSDHLPFIRLPESQEPQDDSDTEDTPTDQVGQPLFPKPS